MSAPPRSADARAASALIIAVLAAGLCPGGGAAQSLGMGAALATLEPGLYCAARDTERREAPGTVSGWIHVPRDPVQRIADGQVVPAELGLGFGVHYSLRDDAVGGTIDFRITHPPMPPGGETLQTWSSTILPGETDTNFFQFDHPEELVLGTWKITAHLNGAPLFSVDFEVVEADTLPGLRDLCRAPDMLSLSPSRRAAAG